MLGLFGRQWGENVMHIFTGEGELVPEAPNTTKRCVLGFSLGRSELSNVSEKSCLFLKFSWIHTRWLLHQASRIWNDSIFFCLICHTDCSLPESHALSSSSWVLFSSPFILSPWGLFSAPPPSHSHAGGAKHHVSIPNLLLNPLDKSLLGSYLHWKDLWMMQTYPVQNRTLLLSPRWTSPSYIPISMNGITIYVRKAWVVPGYSVFTWSLNPAYPGSGMRLLTPSLPLSPAPVH